jgi:hypothetical protein
LAFFCYKTLLNEVEGKKPVLFLKMLRRFKTPTYMKRIFTLCFFLVTYVGSMAQNKPTGFHLEKPISVATLLGSSSSLAIDFSSISEARSIINDITDASGMQQNFKVVSTPQVDNAAAVMYQGQRYILYNPSFINKLDNMANDNWASISVLAHEIGHHLLGHTMDGTGSQIPKELAADEFSGLVLHKMGASLEQAQLAMKLIGSPYASATHPAERDRLVAIAHGWNNVPGQTSNRNVAVNNPAATTYPTYPGNTDERRNYPSQDDRRTSYPRQRTERTTYPNEGRQAYPQTNQGRMGTANSGRRVYGNSQVRQSIVYDIIFNRGNGYQYFITNANTVVVANSNRLNTVARLAPTRSSDYPYVIYDDQTQLYVNTSGNIYSDNGRKVGYITYHR